MPAPLQGLQLTLSGSGMAQGPQHGLTSGGFGSVLQLPVINTNTIQGQGLLLSDLQTTTTNAFQNNANHMATQCLPDLPYIFMLQGNV